MKIVPSILSMDFSKFSETLKIINDNFEYIHFDVMDGHFVPNISFGPYICDAFNKNSDLFMDVHLMIEDPLKYAKNFIDVGADGVTFHIESLNNDINKCNELIDFLHQNNVRAGISIKPDTDVSVIEPLLSRIDLILIMSVNPGFGGQKFIESSIEKVKKLSKLKTTNNLNFIIEIDGGININNIVKCKDAGVDLAVVGSYIFTGDILNNVLKIKKLI